MTNEQLLKMSCERCENYSVNTICEDKENCPVYALFKRAEGKKRIVYKKDTWDVPPPPKPEMI